MTETPVSHLATAIAELQANLPAIEKSETAKVVTQKGSYEYSYANLTSISDAILPLLSKHGLSFVAMPKVEADRFVLAYSLMHKTGERLDGSYPLPSTGTPQSIGSAITYGRRYCLCAVTGIAPDTMDDDGAAAEAEASRGTAQRRTPRKAIQTAKKTAQRASAASDGPPLPGEADTPSDRITQAQMGKLHASLGDLGITDRDTGIAYINDHIDRTVESSKELTKAEASKVIDAAVKDFEEGPS